MVNQSKINDPRFWKKWEASGAIGYLVDHETLYVNMIKRSGIMSSLPSFLQNEEFAQRLFQYAAGQMGHADLIREFSEDGVPGFKQSQELSNIVSESYLGNRYKVWENEDGTRYVERGAEFRDANEKGFHDTTFDLRQGYLVDVLVSPDRNTVVLVRPYISKNGKATCLEIEIEQDGHYSKGLLILDRSNVSWNYMEEREFTQPVQNEFRYHTK